MASPITEQQAPPRLASLIGAAPLPRPIALWALIMMPYIEHSKEVMVPHSCTQVMMPHIEHSIEVMVPHIEHSMEVMVPHSCVQVMVPHIEHVLPMIPGGASFKEIIVDGDGTNKY